jgi:hypothetical protein
MDLDEMGSRGLRSQGKRAWQKPGPMKLKPLAIQNEKEVNDAMDFQGLFPGLFYIGSILLRVLLC